MNQYNQNFGAKKIMAVMLCGAFTLSALEAAAEPKISNVYSEPAPLSAHYPDPDVKIMSPAFMKKKVALTSQSDLEHFVADLAREGADLRVIDLGLSQEGRRIPLLAFSKGGIANPVELSKNGKPTLLVIGGQHGNEPAGGEAALAFAAELVRDTKTAALLNKINVLIVPRANPDGASHHIRGLADGGDVNRDHLLLSSPEGKALSKVFSQYQPEVVIDCHEFSVATRWLKKFGVVQKYDALIQYATVANLPGELTEAAESIFRKPMLESLNKNGLSNSWYYTTSRVDDSKLVSMGGVVPDTGRNIASLRNSISFLIESRGVEIGVDHLKRRVFTHLVAVRSMADSMSRNAAEVLRINKMIRESVVAQAGKGSIGINGKANIERKKIDFRSPQDGAVKSIEVDWASSLSIKPQLTRERPYAYVLKGSETQAVSRLLMLGVTVEKVTAAAVVPGQTYQLASFAQESKRDVTGSAGKVNAAVKRVTTTLADKAIEVSPGDFLVRMNQPLANLVVAALEPESQSSFVANGVLASRLSKQDIQSTLPLLRIKTGSKVQSIAIPALEVAPLR